MLGHVALSGDVRRAKERLLRSREISRSGLGVAEGEQQATPCFLVARIHHLEHVESDPEEADSLLVRENGRGLLPRSPCIRNGLVDVARPRSLAEVVGKLSQVRLRVLCIQALQHLADLPMELHAAGCGETVVQGFTHERVREVHATDSPGYLGHDPRADAFIDDLEESSCGDAACPGECVESELPTEDRCECEDSKARRGQKREAATDHLADPGGGRDPERETSACAYEMPLRGEQTDQLADQKRIPPRFLVDGCDQGRRCGDIEGRFHQPGNVRLVEPSEWDLSSHLLATKLGEGRGQSRVLGPVITVRSDEQDASIYQLARHELEEQKRWSVGRMKVVKEEHERLPSSDAPQERRRGIEETEAGSFRVRRGWHAQLRKQVAELRDDLRNVSRSRTKL
jgi:hypothetical protein